MYDSVVKFIDEALSNSVPAETKGFILNLYDDGDNNWALEIVATSRYDKEDPDWGCDELDDFGTRDNPFTWEKEADYYEIMQEMCGYLSDYLCSGKYADTLKAADGVGMGFVDGELAVLYEKE